MYIIEYYYNRAAVVIRCQCNYNNTKEGYFSDEDIWEGPIKIYDIAPWKKPGLYKYTLSLTIF